MPPRKRARQAPSIKQDFLASLSQDLDSKSSHTDLSPEQLLRAFGLARPRPGAPDDEHLHRTCANKWGEGGDEAMEKEAAPEVVVLSSSEDELAQGKHANEKSKAKDQVVCSAESCGKNPKCLNWLGQEKWENAVKAMQAYWKAAGTGDDPSNEREADLPVGLRNLGATCYVNSLLQVWFQDETFRSGVYACLPPSNGNVESSPLFQLQVLFAFLQTAQQAVYNPEPLVMSLKLDKGEQQDAQEFRKLFMSLLEDEFKKQGNKAASEGGPNVAALVEDQFQGTISYGTQCSACATKSERHSPFLEMEVNLTKNCNLEARIKESFTDEHLSGANQYYCETCDRKRDATRYTALKQLPPVLHISLLRFDFSAEDSTRSKSQHAISYPLKLDMGQFLPLNTHGQRPEVWYDLKGVLMHKGVSAHHGHYVAQVHDGRKNKWFLFDDETVSPIEDLNAPNRSDEEEEVVAKKPKRPKTGFIRTANGDILPKSKDAYMLVYTKRADPGDAERPEPVSPALALSQVQLLDSIHDSEVKAFLEKESVVKFAFDQLREAKQSVYRVWDVQEDDEESFLVDKSELRRWIEQGLKPTAASKPLGSNGVSKTVAVEGASSTVTEDSNMIDAPLAQDADVETTSKVFAKLDSTSVSPTLGGEEPQLEMDVDKVSEQDSNIISNVDITCAHGMINPLQAEQCKRVSQLGVMALRDLGVRLEPELRIPRDICRQCVWGIAAEHLYESEHMDQVTAFNNAAADIEAEGAVWIPRQWLDDWKRPQPKMHLPHAHSDPHPGANPWLQRVCCEHGKLPATRSSKDRTLISAEAASVLQDLFPEWEPVTTEALPCDKCAAALEDSKETEGAMKELAKKEKNVLRLDNQTRLGGNQIIIVPGKPSFVVPLDFARKWVGWSRRPTTDPRPPRLDNSAFLCKHQRFLLDVNTEIESAEVINVVSEPEWRLLQASYDAGPAIKIFVDDASNYQTVPASCASCLEERRKDFLTTQIKIKMLSADDLDETGARKQEESSPSECAIIELAPAPAKHSASRTYGSMASTSFVRTSARLKRRPQLMLAKTLKTLEIAKEDSVKDLKIKISDSFGIPTIYQRLFIDGRELNNDETVEVLGLCRGALLELFEVQVDENISLDQLDDAIDPSVRPKRGKKSREEGFDNTGLFGWESREKDPQMDVDADDDVGIVASGSGSAKKTTGSNVKNGRRKPTEPDMEACPTCTFEQEAGFDECTVCSLPMHP